MRHKNEDSLFNFSRHVHHSFFFFFSGSFLKELIDKKGFHKLCLLVGYEYNAYELAR